MAEDQVRAELDVALRDPSLKNSLKAHVRARLLSKLRGPTPVKSEDLTSRVLSSLVLDYLRKSGFEFTISVYVPESGAGTGLGANEIAQLLGISDWPEGESLLAYIVTEYQKTIARPHLHESACQTEDYKAIGHLEDRLHSVEMQYLSKMKSLPDAHMMEERMLQYQRDCEARLRLEMEHEINRIREVEIIAVRLEESGKYRKQLQSAREELESQWNTRLEQLKERDREGSGRLLLREKDLETQLYLHRQQVLRDMELLKAKEQEVKRYAQVEAQATKLEKDTWEARRLEVDAKVKELDKLRLALEHKAESDFDQFKREYETRHLSERHKLLDEQAELERAKRRLQDEQERISAFKQEFASLKEALGDAKDGGMELRAAKERLQEELRNAQEQLRQVGETGRRDLDLLALREQEIAALKTELQLFRDMLEESRAASKALDERHREVVTHLGEELQRLKKSEPEKVTSAAISTEMSLRWRQLERDEEDLKRQALDWIKPAYRQGRSPLKELYAPQREPLPAESIRPVPAYIRAEETVRVEETKGEGSGGLVGIRPAESSRIPSPIPTIRPEFRPNEASIPTPTTSNLQPSPSLPPPSDPLPKPQPKAAEPVVLQPLAEAPSEPDLAEYEVRQQRKRQLEFFGEESEGSSIYSDRFE